MEVNTTVGQNIKNVNSGSFHKTPILNNHTVEQDTLHFVVIKVFIERHYLSVEEICETRGANGSLVRDAIQSANGSLIRFFSYYRLLRVVIILLLFFCCAAAIVLFQNLLSATAVGTILAFILDKHQFLWVSLDCLLTTSRPIV